MHFKVHQEVQIPSIEWSLQTSGNLLQWKTIPKLTNINGIQNLVDTYLPSVPTTHIIQFFLTNILRSFFCRSWEGCLAGASQLQNPRRRLHSQQERIGEERAHSIAERGDSAKQSHPRLQSRRLALHRRQYRDRNPAPRWMASKS